MPPEIVKYLGAVYFLIMFRIFGFKWGRASSMKWRCQDLEDLQVELVRCIYLRSTSRISQIRSCLHDECVSDWSTPEGIAEIRRNEKQ